ncbi:MAG: PEP-CTERM sorting domain-containing protein [Akkermansiaceae bacterium]
MKIKPNAILVAFTAVMALGSAQAATTLTFTFTNDTGADFSAFTGTSSPITINDIAATADGEAFTFDLTLSGTVGSAGGTPVAGTVFTSQRPRFDFDATDTDFKTLTLTIDDIQGAVVFDGFVSVDRFDNLGGDPWDVNGQTISATGNTVAITTITGSMTITQLANSGGGSNGATRFEGFQAQFSAVPEPSSTALLGLGGLALMLRRRK